MTFIGLWQVMIKFSHIRSNIFLHNFVLQVFPQIFHVALLEFYDGFSYKNTFNLSSQMKFSHFVLELQWSKKSNSEVLRQKKNIQVTKQGIPINLSLGMYIYIVICNALGIPNNFLPNRFMMQVSVFVHSVFLSERPRRW